MINRSTHFSLPRHKFQATQQPS